MNITERTRESVDLANKVLATYAKGKIKQDELAPAICKKLNITKQQLHSVMGLLKRAGKVSWQVPNIVPKRRLVRVKSTNPMKYEDYMPMPKTPASPAKTKVTKVTKITDKGNGKDALNGKDAINGGKRKYTKRKPTTDSIKVKDKDLSLQGINSEITLIANPSAMARFFRELKQ